MSDTKDQSRSEQVRLRRESNTTKRVQRARKDATRPAPPVTSRTRQAGAAPRRKPAQNARRRYQVSVPTARADARPISIPRPRLGIRLLSFLLALMIGAAIYFVYTLPYFRVTQAQVTGNQLISAEELSAALSITGQPIFLLKPSDLETRLRLNYPELASARVSISLPNVVSVDVVERRPVVRWEQSGGYTWIAEDGVAFRPRGEIAELISVTAVSAPVLDLKASDPLNPVPFISKDMVQALKGLGTHVPPGMSILYDPALGFGWNDPRGWSVYFGTSSYDIELKMRVYETMVNSLTQRGIRPVLINVTYPTAPYYRMSQ
jgi:cell division septal protein FtsQ